MSMKHELKIYKSSTSFGIEWHGTAASLKKAARYAARLQSTTRIEAGSTLLYVAGGANVISKYKYNKRAPQI